MTEEFYSRCEVEVHTSPPFARKKAKNGHPRCLKNEDEKCGRGHPSVPGPQKRGTWGTQILVWRGGPPGFSLSTGPAVYSQP